MKNVYFYTHFTKLTWWVIKWLNSQSIMSHSERKKLSLPDQIVTEGYIDGEENSLSQM